jgi:hypothetical protein
MDDTFVLHCNHCGRPMRDCGGQCDARLAIMRAVCDSLALANVPTPVITPVGAPALPPRVKFGGYMICSICRMEESFCGCGKHRAPGVPPKDGGETGLAQRIRDWKGTP